MDLSVCSPSEESPRTDMAKDAVWPARASVQGTKSRLDLVHWV